MDNVKAKINYLYHSGFIVETKTHILIFDYFNHKGVSEEISLSSGVIPDEVFKTEKNIIVFASHSHGDHFNPIIFEWKNINSNIKYVLSSDIQLKDTYPESYIIAEGSSLNLGAAFIKAYGSTDLGVSFLVKVDKLNIFHAGDLNWWHWKDESDDYNEEMAKAFKQQISNLKHEKIDIAFFPVDHRLEEYYYLGGKYFIENLEPMLFIPMHFANDPTVTEDFKNKFKWQRTEIVEINKRGQQILF
ncbi:MBL fold metallo-hydrolase [Clostridium sp. DJ247]|uniref:MBL fold metallo-hydrolase n=1 Tax=Clostridium sp. DJ247 TaxID=2726188 RepID=UPI001629FD1F|nr:MBL fold metallo-hydrolase [Clostridium sp. DJ247]MBC2581829.1 MBL fold metallo-hydrolase [Clostridium sp. DJ247]